MSLPSLSLRAWVALSLSVFVVGCTNDRGERGGSTGDAGSFRAARLIATSETHSCALRDSGLYCWGSNYAGQLGNIRTEDSTVPVLAHFAGPDIAQLALAVGRTCVLRSTGAVACWGTNDRGQMGDGSHTNSYTPAAAVGINDAKAIAIDEASSCVLHAGDAGVSCWGYAPADLPGEGSVVPQPVLGLTSVVELRVGSLGTYCVREAAGAVKCWRFEEGKWTTPAEIPDLAGARTIAMTYSDATCALTPTGEIKCHSFDTQLTQTVEGTQGSVAMAAAGGMTVCGANAALEWRCWPILPNLDVAVLQVQSSVSIVDLTMMGLRICALRQDSTVACVTPEDLDTEADFEFPDLVPVPLPE
jgi:hypothetical protein